MMTDVSVISNHVNTILLYTANFTSAKITILIYAFLVSAQNRSYRFPFELPLRYPQPMFELKSETNCIPIFSEYFDMKLGFERVKITYSCIHVAYVL